MWPGPAEIANLAVLRLRLPSGRVTLFILGGSFLLADTPGSFLSTSALAHGVEKAACGSQLASVLCWSKDLIHELGKFLIVDDLGPSGR
jgi:hypothetical protein